LSDPKAYFKQPVFHLLAKELWRRYWLKGTFGSSVGLGIFHQVDSEPLRSFMGISILVWKQKKRIRVADLEQAFAESILKWTLSDFVVFITKKPLALKATFEQSEALAFEQFKETVKSIDPCFTSLLTERQLKEWWKKEPANLRMFKQVSKALANLPKHDFLRMPVFAYHVTGSPHAFDEKQDAGVLLLQMLTAMSARLPEELLELEKAEQRHSLLNEFYLLKDDIMNYAAIRGLTARDAKNKENQLWRQACIEGISWNVPLKEILRMTTIHPYVGEKVLVVENSGIYSILVELLPEVPILCSSGQFTFAIWQLLRKLAATGTVIYYSGDIDLEGLGMAQKLKNMFASQLKFLGMTQPNFQLAESDIPLSDSRLKKLNNLKEPQLVWLGQLIRQEQKVAYQEGFLEELLAEVRCVFTGER
jgi:uncharacterized protein (TIGR02679 family)